MTVRELAANLGLEILTGEVNLEGKVNYGYTSDLLSDVIANAPEDCVWVTVQRHINILGVAKLKNIAAIVTPRNLKVDKEVIERAKVEGIALLRTAHSAFEISGLLYGILKR
ncbi:MAG: DRTGG domain protein [Syntrophorhabdaceae bacterium PtaU1.Bin034]|jgi:predicted transcriptional regulator|nr:MAG: DRTGG domain protein [Syntrophorhabdaceae bacterium PtaU1.Bin034]